MHVATWAWCPVIERLLFGPPHELNSARSRGRRRSASWASKFGLRFSSRAICFHHRHCWTITVVLAIGVSVPTLDADSVNNEVLLMTTSILLEKLSPRHGSAYECHFYMSSNHHKYPPVCDDLIYRPTCIRTCLGSLGGMMTPSHWRLSTSGHAMGVKWRLMHIHT